ncbi:MAG: hypothetical protein IT494_02995 [Gammaproteobacteria bacterium]|nr:hypothetical protein [Gammaproteobacteria bacterium]
MTKRNVFSIPARATAPERTNRQCIVRSLTFAIDRERRGLRVSVADAAPPESAATFGTAANVKRR